MPITDELRKNLTNPSPLYVAAGTADLAMQKLRELPATMDRLRAEAPERLPKLREQAQSMALQGVGIALEYAVKARETYDELAERGRVLVETRLGGEDEHGPGHAVKVERVEPDQDDAPVTEPTAGTRQQAKGQARTAEQAKEGAAKAGDAKAEAKPKSAPKAADSKAADSKDPKAKAAPRRTAPRRKPEAPAGGEEQQDS